jgi:hypothetical protein
VAILYIEWRSYDTNELTVVCDEHIGPIAIDFDDLDFRSWKTCTACFKDPREAATCEIDITESYHNLLKTLSIVITLAAAAQRERMSDGKCSLSS